MKRFEVSYDRGADDLFVYEEGTRSKGAVELGQFVLDFGPRGLVALEVMDASKILSKLTGERITKRTLANIVSARVSTDFVKRAIVVKLMLCMLVREKTVERAFSIPLPNFRSTSPVSMQVHG